MNEFVNMFCNNGYGELMFIVECVAIMLIGLALDEMIEKMWFNFLDFSLLHSSRRNNG